MGRGIDFKGVNLVINYDFPNSAISYIHRIGKYTYVYLSFIWRQKVWNLTDFKAFSWVVDMNSSSIFGYWFDKMEYILKPRGTLNASFFYGMLNSDSSVKEIP